MTQTKKSSSKKCGLCGSTKNLIKTECCNEWICNDEDQYQLFSYKNNSCYRNHRRMTLCGYHHTEEHPGNWETCEECKESFEDDLEIFVFYGTNEFNFKVLKNPPKFKPTKCMKCNAIINKSLGGYTESSKGSTCYDCSPKI